MFAVGTKSNVDIARHMNTVKTGHSVRGVKLRFLRNYPNWRIAHLKEDPEMTIAEEVEVEATEEGTTAEEVEVKVEVEVTEEGTTREAEVIEEARRDDTTVEEITGGSPRRRWTLLIRSHRGTQRPLLWRRDPLGGGMGWMQKGRTNGPKRG